MKTWDGVLTIPIFKFIMAIIAIMKIFISIYFYDIISVVQKLHFSITINATPEKVWHTMLDANTYKEWTNVFQPGSYFEGDWTKGSKILFLGPSEDGKLGGMVSTIAENKPNEYISIKHVGIVADGVEDTTSEEAKKWHGFENYTFKDLGDKTELLIDIDANAEFDEYFKTTWPKALEKLKELAET